jgi:sulfatase modifying factor 1
VVISMYFPCRPWFTTAFLPRVVQGFPMQTITRMLIPALVFGMPLSAAAAEKYALLIAVARYDHAEMNKPAPLEFPEEDAKALGKLLESGGYKVDLLLGKAATQDAIKSKLKALQKKADAEGVVLIGLFGHGVEVDTVDANGDVIKDGCFCPYDTAMREAVDFKGKPALDAKGKAQIEPDPDTLIKLGDLMRTLKLAKAGNRIVLADCCRTTPNAARGRSFGANFSVQDLPENTSLLFGCSPNEQAFEHKDWGHGAFTKCLLDAIGELSTEGSVDTAQLASQMKKRVPALVASVSPRDRQTPKPFITDVVDLQLEMKKSLPTNPDLITNSIDMNLKLIPAGEFLMGSNSSRGDLETAGFVLSDTFDNSDEQPAHRVRITKPFYLGIHEVTRGQFAAFVNDSGYQTEAEKDGKGGYGFDAAGNGAQKPEYNWKDNGMSQTDSHPVINVSWNDAVEFIKWLSKKEGKPYRLPTEAEWEYSCRAGSETHFSSGDGLGSLKGFGNVLDTSYKGKYTNNDDKVYQPFPFDDGFVYTSPVGRFRANKYGLFDMHGNVFEWCSDWYGKDYYATSPLTDPAGPTLGSLRVLRGGGWFSDAAFCRSAFRYWIVPSYRYSLIGLRVALSPSGQ